MPSSPVRLHVSASTTTQQLEERIEQLERDLRSAQSRNTILRGALQRARFADGDSRHLSTVTAPAGLPTALTLARMVEEAGGVPAIRFARAEDGVIAGLEFSIVKGGPLPGRPSEMAVVDDDDATGYVG